MGWLEQRRRERDDELLSAYIDGQLLGRARSEFEARLAREPELRARLEATRRVLGMVRSLPTVPAPRNFILDPARYGARARSRPAARFYPTLRLATVLATLVLLVVFAGDLITQMALPFGAAAPAPPQVGPAPQLGMRELSAATAAPQPGQPLPQTVPQTAAPPVTQPTQPPVPPTQAPETQPTAMAKAAGPQVKATPSPPAPGRSSSQSPGGGSGQTDKLATPSAAGPSVAAVLATPPPTPPAPTVAPSPVSPTPTAMPSPVPATPTAVSQALPAAPQQQPPTSAYSGERPVGPTPWRIAEAGLVTLVILLTAATILARRWA